MRYTYGTGNTAAKRLEKMAEVFNPHALKFVKEFIKYPAGTAVDLGCGPGFTTEMLAEASGASEVYGFDQSEVFVTMASERFKPLKFLKHDVTKTPFPVKPDVIYLRFLLSHLCDPVGLINRWVKELNPGGIMLIDETEGVETEIDAFRKYQKINRGLISSQGARLYIGETLSLGVYNAAILMNECVELPVKNCDAAAMFYPNTISVWEKEKYVLDSVSAQERKRISGSIKEIMSSNDRREQNTWRLRRIALRKDKQG
jgi:SAM-dependent methyltransferase